MITNVAGRLRFVDSLEHTRKVSTVAFAILRCRETSIGTLEHFLHRYHSRGRSVFVGLPLAVTNKSKHRRHFRPKSNDDVFRTAMSSAITSSPQDKRPAGSGDRSLSKQVCSGESGTGSKGIPI